MTRAYMLSWNGLREHIFWSAIASECRVLVLQLIDNSQGDRNLPRPHPPELGEALSTPQIVQPSRRHNPFCKCSSAADGCHLLGKCCPILSARTLCLSETREFNIKPHSANLTARLVQVEGRVGSPIKLSRLLRGRIYIVQNYGLLWFWWCQSSRFACRLSTFPWFSGPPRRTSRNRAHRQCNKGIQA